MRLFYTSSGWKRWTDRRMILTMVTTLKLKIGMEGHISLNKTERHIYSTMKVTFTLVQHMKIAGIYPIKSKDTKKMKRELTITMKEAINAIKIKTTENP